MLLWLGVASLSSIGLGMAIALAKTYSRKRAACVLLGLIWALPFFAIFIHWLLAETPLAFGGPLTYRRVHPAATAFLGLGMGLAIVYGAMALARGLKRPTR